LQGQPGASVLAHVTQLRDDLMRRSAREIVADKIASVIASGVLQVGDALPSERDLAAAIQVSRETVRGGVQILAARGIIEVSHGARTRVVSSDVGSFTAGLRPPRDVNAYDIEAVHAARMLAELAVVAEAARRIDQPTLRLLDDALAAQSAAAGDPVRFLISDREFHFAIYRSCGNPVLADFVSDLYAYMMEFRRKAVSRPGAILKSHEDHVAIVEGLRRHDPRSVVAAFERHLKRICATTIAIMDDGGPGEVAPVATPRRAKRANPAERTGQVRS
jgi:DNA-binding FadR family transcriptional regulator